MSGSRARAGCVQLSSLIIYISGRVWYYILTFTSRENYHFTPVLMIQFHRQRKKELLGECTILRSPRFEKEKKTNFLQ